MVKSTKFKTIVMAQSKLLNVFVFVMSVLVMPFLILHYVKFVHFKK